MWPVLLSVFRTPEPPPPEPPPPPQGLVVHEWGTFTVVAGRDGAPVRWRPLLGPSDLPDFVYTPDELPDAIRGPAFQGKGDPTRVRMETPVLYFYAPHDMRIEVAVDFPEGTITEWYPRARSWTGSRIEWGQVVLASVFAEEALPHDGSDSHYYPAREVDATPLRVCDGRGNEHERFLFYRGVGDFPLTLRAALDDRGLSLVPQGPVPERALVFERDGDAVGFTIVGTDGTTLRPTLDDTLPDVLDAVRATLLAEGLYAREADAMIETWRTDWFEDGLRVLYVLPREETDRRLPLTVTPAPEEVVRVIVGRIEVPTPEQDAAMAAVLASSEPDARVLAQVNERFGRFAEPLLARSDDPRGARLLGPLPPTTTVR